MYCQQDLDQLRAHHAVDVLEYFEETPSTNDLAIASFNKGDVGSRLFLAGRQTAGRGRLGNQWWAGEGALVFSLLLNMRTLKVPRTAWGRMPLATGLAVCQAVQALSPDLYVAVKWPNDVYLDNRKVAGILVEACSDHPESLVVGVGINVNNSTENAPAKIADLAVSLLDCAVVTTPTEVLLEVLGRLEQAVKTLTTAPSDLIEELNRMCYLTGREIELDLGLEQVRGRCHGIAESGALQIATSAGLREFFTGTVRLHRRT